MPYPIVLVDDHDLVRGGLQFLIEEGDHFVVTAQFSNGADLLRDLATLAPRPEVIILDLDMPVMNGRETLQRLQAGDHAYQVLILTISGDDDTILDLVRLGARGFLPKYCTRQELKKALSDIIKTGFYHSELQVKAMHQSVMNTPQNIRGTETEYLTQRELEFIRLVCDKRELPYKLIADEMKVAFRTVDGYRESVFLKLNIKSKLGLVFYALRQGIVKMTDFSG